jgi:hypothetical protein
VTLVIIVLAAYLNNYIVVDGIQWSFTAKDYRLQNAIIQQPIVSMLLLGSALRGGGTF